MSDFLRCPKCGERLSGVIDSRPSADGKATRRRRICRGCEARWTTYEISAKEYERLMPVLDKVEDLGKWCKQLEIMLKATKQVLEYVSEPRRIKAVSAFIKSRSRYSYQDDAPRPTG
jgi:hypothetical protein